MNAARLFGDNGESVLIKDEPSHARKRRLLGTTRAFTIERFELIEFQSCGNNCSRLKM